MPIRRILGLVLIGAAYWLMRGRVVAMSFEVNNGNSWGGVLSDVTYLIPILGTFIALAGGVWAALGGNGRITASIGTALVLLFVGLVFAMSGMLEMIEPFLLPAIVMTAATIGLVITQPK